MQDINLSIMCIWRFGPPYLSTISRENADEIIVKKLERELNVCSKLSQSAWSIEIASNY